MHDLSGPNYVVDCVAVKSGDRIVVEDQAGTRKTVHLYGVDAPETDQPHGPAAREALRSSAEGKRVEIDVVDEDRCGHVVGRVRAGRTGLGPWLVRNGHAWHDHRQAPEADRLASLQRQARRADRGLWSRVNPVPPWEHRGSDSRARSPFGKLVELAASFVWGGSSHDEPVATP